MTKHLFLKYFTALFHQFCNIWSSTKCFITWPFLLMWSSFANFSYCSIWKPLWGSPHSHGDLLSIWSWPHPWVLHSLPYNSYEPSHHFFPHVLLSWNFVPYFIISFINFITEYVHVTICSYNIFLSYRYTNLNVPWGYSAFCSLKHQRFQSYFQDLFVVYIQVEKVLCFIVVKYT